MDVKSEDTNLTQIMTDHDAIIEMKGTLGRAAGDVKDLLDLVKITHQDHEKRILALEQWKREFNVTYRLVMGIAAFVGAVIGVIAQTLIAAGTIHK